MNLELKENEGLSEQVNISQHVKCKHKDLTVGNGFIRCKCGMEWRGSRLDKLYRLLMSRK